MGNELWFYRWLERLGWPHSYLGKIFFIAFVATHLPLLFLVGFLVFGPTDPAKLAIFWLVLLATLFDTVVSLWALKQLFQPILLTTRALSLYLNEGQIVQLPTHFQDEAGKLMGSVAYAVQTFERRQRTLEQLASEDFLTRLPNRRAADDRLRQSLRLAARDRGPLCIALMDIDQFKQINDQYGHAIGDQVLARLSQELKIVLRGSDWAARWGGEEFLLVLFSNVEGTQTALERVRVSLARLTIATDRATIKFTVSIGFTKAHAGDQPQTAVERADQALYLAKQAGRNRVRFYELEAA